MFWCAYRSRYTTDKDEFQPPTEVLVPLLHLASVGGLCIPPLHDTCMPMLTQVMKEPATTPLLLHHASFVTNSDVRLPTNEGTPVQDIDHSRTGGGEAEVDVLPVHDAVFTETRARAAIQSVDDEVVDLTAAGPAKAGAGAAACSDGERTEAVATGASAGTCPDHSERSGYDERKESLVVRLGSDECQPMDAVYGLCVMAVASHLRYNVCSLSDVVAHYSWRVLVALARRVRSLRLWPSSLDGLCHVMTAAATTFHAAGELTPDMLEWMVSVVAKPASHNLAAVRTVAASNAVQLLALYDRLGVGNTPGRSICIETAVLSLTVLTPADLALLSRDTVCRAPRL